MDATPMLIAAAQEIQDWAAGMDQHSHTTTIVCWDSPQGRNWTVSVVSDKDHPRIYGSSNKSLADAIRNMEIK